MKLLVIGSGGGEHALAWKLAQSPRVQKVYVAPGNAGTALEPGLENVALSALPDLVSFARKENVQLTVVGPEAPLAAGVVDAFGSAGLRIFGPTRAAAQLESSKDFAKSFMARHGIPTARHASFERAADAKAYVVEHGAPIVGTADCLDDDRRAMLDDIGRGVRGALRSEEHTSELQSLTKLVCRLLPERKKSN